MSSYKNIVLIIFICIFFSCKEKNSSEVNYSSPQFTIDFDFEKDVKQPDVFFELIDSIKIVKLQTGKDYLIAHINKILCDKDYVYVLDSQTKTLFKYTKAGDFVSKIAKIGRGPGEYVEPADFCLFEEGIAILDGGSEKIIVYSKNGDFIKEFKQKSMADKFAIIESNYFSLLNEDKSFFSNKNIYIIDDNGKVIKEMMEIPAYAKDKNLSLYKPIEYFGQEVLYTEAFNNRIFGITKDSVYVKYDFNFGKYNLTEDFLNANINLTASEMLLKMYREGMVNSLDYFNENSKYLYFNVLKGGKNFKLFYDKSENNSYAFDTKLLPQWMIFAGRPFIYSDDEKFVSVFSASAPSYMDEQMREEIRENKIFSKLYDEIENMDESSNPYLIYYYFK